MSPEPQLAPLLPHDSSRPLKRQRKNTAVHDPPPPPPQASSSYDATPTHHVDHIFITEGNVTKKSGGKKAPLSCCECRRLKLKCDRNFPCASCKKRGCAEICPEGVLVSGKGTRFILANTEQLHTKIHEMSERIRQLEDALTSCNCLSSSSTRSGSSSPSHPHAPDTHHHPLLAPELLTIKSTMGLYNGTQVSAAGNNPNGGSSGPPVVNGVNGAAGHHHHHHVKEDEKDGDMKMEIDQGHARAHINGIDRRRGSSSEGSTINGFGGAVLDHAQAPTRSDSSDALFAEVVKLSQSYPLPDNISPEPNLKLREYIRGMLPPREEADYLWQQALQNALWQYNPHPSETFFPNLSYHCYHSPIEDLSPRRLALLFMILAVGCLVDLHKRPPDSPDAEQYHQLARASLCEIPVMEETNVETITALFYEIWYLLVFSDKKKAAGYAWGLMGLTAKLAQSIGLHRNSGGSKVIPEEVEKRRSLFWELLYLDARLSLSLGRPPSLCIRHMDCPRPSYQPDHGCDPSESLHYYQEWKHSCYTECLAPVLEMTSSPNMLDYNGVIELDTKIRDFSFPPPLRSGAKPHSRSLSMQKASLSIALEAVLLQLHRSFFTRALSGPEESFNRRHKYAPSVVAVFLSATRMIATVQDLYNREPQLTARILGYWSNAFSAAVALCLLVSRAPFTCLSPAALQELERARVLFKSARDTCPRALQVIPILETMVNKANDIYHRWSEGQEVQTVLKHVVNNDPKALEIDAAAAAAAAAMASMTGAVGVGVGGFNLSPSSPLSSNTYISPSPPPTSSSSSSNLVVAADPFSRTHHTLAQCIVEVHERAKALFPNRKPCSCSVRTPADRDRECPPSHFWAPPPVGIPKPRTPVLPEMDGYSQLMFMPPAAKRDQEERMKQQHQQRQQLQQLQTQSLQQHSQQQQHSHTHSPHLSFSLTQGQGQGQVQQHQPKALSPGSKMAAVVETLNFELGALQNTEQTWMSFF